MAVMVASGGKGGEQAATNAAITAGAAIHAKEHGCRRLVLSVLGRVRRVRTAHRPARRLAQVPLQRPHHRTELGRLMQPDPVHDAQEAPQGGDIRNRFRKIQNRLNLILCWLTELTTNNLPQESGASFLQEVSGPNPTMYTDIYRWKEP